MPAEQNANPLLDVRGLTKVYRRGHGLLRKQQQVVAVDGVELQVRAGKTFALLGESGSGKSTLARCIAALEKPTSGTVSILGRDVFSLERNELFDFRRSVQLIFQDSSSALNPRFTAEHVIAEPLAIQGIGTASERRGTARRLMEKVGLTAEMLPRGAKQFSGGQRQRLAIARALTLQPTLLVLDEALTGLDLPVQSQVLELLRSLRTEFNLTYLFISHDLRLMAGIADEIAIMQRGRIVERGTPRELLANPQHDHTRELIAAVPGVAAPALPRAPAPIAEEKR